MFSKRSPSIFSHVRLPIRAAGCACQDDQLAEGQTCCEEANNMKSHQNGHVVFLLMQNLMHKMMILDDTFYDQVSRFGWRKRLVTFQKACDFVDLDDISWSCRILDPTYNLKSGGTQGGDYPLRNWGTFGSFWDKKNDQTIPSLTTWLELLSLDIFIWTLVQLGLSGNHWEIPQSPMTSRKSPLPHPQRDFHDDCVAAFPELLLYTARHFESLLATDVSCIETGRTTLQKN